MSDSETEEPWEKGVTIGPDPIPNLVETINNCHKKIEDIYRELIPDGDFGKLIDKYVDCIDSGGAAFWPASDSFLNECFGNFHDACGDALKASIMYTLQSERAYGSKRTEEAWSSIAQAMYYCGMAKVGLFDKFILKSEDKRMDVPSMGGQARSAKSQLVRSKAIDLLRLHQDRPEGGWKNQNEAINAILEQLKEFVKENKISLSPLGLPDRLKSWKREYPYFGKAFDEFIAKKSADQK